MIAKTENYQLNSELTLHDSTQIPLTLPTSTLTLTQENEQIIDCRLTFHVNIEIYQRIDTNALFNLKPEIRGLLSAGDFQPSPDIQIETILKPDLLPLLLKNATNASEAAAYLLNLSQQQSELISESNNEIPENSQSPSSLLSTESWLALSVKQQQKSGETGYRTFWSYLNPQTLSEEGLNSEALSESLTTFFKDLVSGSLSVTTKELATETIEAISNLFQEIAQDKSDSINLSPKSEGGESLVNKNSNSSSASFNPILHNCSQIPTFPREAVPQYTTSNSPIFQAIINFFTQDDWAFTKNKGELSLNLAFEGDNGRWKCYAKAREKQQQFVFYSICPISAPESKLMAIAEFITRANYGMIIGNFELDFTDGEIRYKTGIDVEGDKLTLALIKQLVYANVTMMDEYLSGIKAVIENDILPEDAIAQIEQ